jgi:hypothetical protein
MLKIYSEEAYLCRVFHLGIRKGYASLIWGYTKTKRLRTPDLEFNMQQMKMVFTLSQGFSNFSKHFQNFHDPKMSQTTTNLR